MKTIEFIGGGRITKIILLEFEKANITFDKVTVYNLREEVL